MIIGLTGAAGCGKDTVAEILSREYGFQIIAFSDALYEEVSTAFHVPVAFLKNRETKEKRSFRLSMGRCVDSDFVRVVRDIRRSEHRPTGFSIPYSPRQILQWWGTDYRRAQCATYWIDKVRVRLDVDLHWAITGVRFQDEADLVRELGGQMGLVLRPGIEPVEKHVSEAFWRMCNPDMVFRNEGTLEDLAELVRHAVTKINSGRYL
ncbi:AAA family ATPase [Acidithiobacillus thiooxidans]|uniref:deoxynucleotide monophosphate kinase family protein n=1 Tax=Acidithiobacillus thiooxidans TaxID=930 RepID=UPI001C07B238|nr:AAA family ATPase [Acidithiobacillus thiooxidans]MBU2793111.1 AAA family ATPase [Acidithiobacillus thiooxidans]